VTQDLLDAFGQHNIWPTLFFVCTVFGQFNILLAQHLADTMFYLHRNQHNVLLAQYLANTTFIHTMFGQHSIYSHNIWPTQHLFTQYLANTTFCQHNILPQQHLANTTFCKCNILPLQHFANTTFGQHYIYSYNVWPKSHFVNTIFCQLNILPMLHLVIPLLTSATFF